MGDVDLPNIVFIDLNIPAPTLGHHSYSNGGWARRSLTACTDFQPSQSGRTTALEVASVGLQQTAAPQHLSGGTGRPTREADNLTIICE
jgi:hypothetical protein